MKLLLATCWLCILVCVANTEVIKPDGPRWPRREFRAVWIATVANIDWPGSRNDSSHKQKQDLITFLDKLHDLKFNAVVFQVRTAGDAFYNSSLEPWSYFLSGKQGKPPSPYYDPLQVLIKEAHQRNIEVHAWFNPYIAKNGAIQRKDLAPNNMAIKFPQYAYVHGHFLWMDPGAKEVEDQCYDVILDVVKRYDVDGAHMDDFFYPYPIMTSESHGYATKGAYFPDNATYERYRESGGRLSHDDWRRDNVNRLIYRLHKGIKAQKPWVKFGLSPFGIWKSGHPVGVRGLSSYSVLYADSRKWFHDGWVDYMTPQLYWKIDPPQQSFTHLMDWWLRQNANDRHFYPGCYAGRVVVSNWPVSEITRQVQETRKRSGKLGLGNIFFSGKYFRDDSKGISGVFKSQVYTSPALAPVMSWLKSRVPPTPSGVKVKSGTISWSKDTSGDVRSWAVYRFESDEWSIVSVLNSNTLSFMTSRQDGKYAITAVDRLSRQSEAVVVNVLESIHVIG